MENRRVIVQHRAFHGNGRLFRMSAPFVCSKKTAILLLNPVIVDHLSHPNIIA